MGKKGQSCFTGCKEALKKSGPPGHIVGACAVITFITVAVQLWHVLHKGVHG